MEKMKDSVNATNQSNTGAKMEDISQLMASKPKPADQPKASNVQKRSSASNAAQTLISQRDPQIKTEFA